MENKIPATFLDYARMSDVIYRLGKYANLKFSVDLMYDIPGSDNENKVKRSFHQEYRYLSNNNPKPVFSIQRRYNYYFTIDYNIDNNKGSVRIEAYNMVELLEKLRQVSLWFTNSDLEVFVEKDGNLIVYNNPGMIQVYGLPFDHHLGMSPIILDYNDNYIPGVRLYLNSESAYTDITVDMFMGLYYILKTYNMPLSAQTMLNYIQRPELGTNCTNFCPEIPYGETKKTNFNGGFFGNVSYGINKNS